MCATSRAPFPAKGDRLQRKVGNEDWGEMSQWHEPLSFDLESYVAVRFLLGYERGACITSCLTCGTSPWPTMVSNGRCGTSKAASPAKGDQAAAAVAVMGSVTKACPASPRVPVNVPKGSDWRMAWHWKHGPRRLRALQKEKKGTKKCSRHGCRNDAASLRAFFVRPVSRRMRRLREG